MFGFSQCEDLVFLNIFVIYLSVKHCKFLLYKKYLKNLKYVDVGSLTLIGEVRLDTLILNCNGSYHLKKKLRKEDDRNTDSKKLNNGDVKVPQQVSMPPVQKPAKAKPNILRKKCIAVATRIANKRNGVRPTLKCAESMSFIQKNLDCSDKDDTEVYIVDQSDFSDFLLEKLEVVNGGRTDVESTENLQETLAHQYQVPLMNKSNKLSKYGENIVCRTCLTLTDSEKCKKLFDNKRAEESRKLREKLVYIADEMNFKASFNAVVCQKCEKLIDVTYAFKKQVKAIENQIRKRINQSSKHSIIDLQSLRRDDGSAEVSQKNNYDCLDDYKYVNLDSLEVWKSTIRASKVQGMEGTNTGAVNDAGGSQDIHDDNGVLGKDNQSDNVSYISRRNKYRNLEEYLVTRKEQLDRISVKYPRHFKTNGENTLPIRVPDFDRILSKKLKVPLEKSEEIFNKVENGPVSNCTLNLEGSVQLNQEIAENAGSSDWDKCGGPSESGRSNLDAYLVRRQGRIKKFNYTNQFSNSSLRVLKNQRRLLDGENMSKLDEGKLLSPAYMYLFNTGTITKKKPDVPKTWDLFDREHDKYFENLVGEVGCFMVRKWSKFATRLRGIGNGPFLCEDCGFCTDDKSKFYRHMGTHRTKMTMCSYCGKLVRSGQHLKYHIKVKHMQPSYKCKHCQKKFHLSTNMATHIARLHNGRNHMVQCQLCGKFMRNGSLSNHMSRHDKKVFTCDVCNGSFYCKNNLYRHRRKHFTNERYPCSSCPKTYKSKSTLRQHTFQIHERLWEWSCEICDRLFSRKEHLKRHMRVVHGSILVDNKKREVVEEHEKCDESTASPQVMDVNVETIEQTENVIVCKNDDAQSYYIF